MDKIEKFKTMEKILREIEDLKNSETAVIKKIGQIETENMNANVQGLDKSLNEIYDGVYKNLQSVEDLQTSFTETVADFKSKNNITDEMLLELVNTLFLVMVVQGRHQEYPSPFAIFPFGVFKIADL
jgi:septation ring formation regulator EzrA